MERKKDRFTGKPVSRLGYGVMRLPVIDGKDGQIDVPKAEGLIHEAYAKGVNYFDTAYPYHEGASEGFLGRALARYPRESYFLADKMPVWLLKEPGDVPRIFEEQLQKCRVSYFDYYLCHSLSAVSIGQMEQNEVIPYLDREKRAGRIHLLGFSFHDSPEVLGRILDLYDWDFVQLQINYIDWDAQEAKQKYEMVTARGIPVLVMEPLRGGALASLSTEAVAILEETAPEASVSSWGIRFAASLPNVQTVLSGMGTEEQLADNAATMESFRPLSREEEAVLAQAAEVYKKTVVLPCTGCRYCMDCPQGVDIPGLFASYNRYLLYKDSARFKAHWKELGAEKQPQSCVRCGLCETHCPQKIQIPQRLLEVQKRAAALGL